MTAEELDNWAADFAAFHARFAHLFGRKEPREQAMKYVRASVDADGPEEQLAIGRGDGRPDPGRHCNGCCTGRTGMPMQARDILQQFVIERFGDEEAIGVVDETGFIKKGTRSVGVKRQYSGTAGKIENCQIGTFLDVCQPGGTCLSGSAAVFAGRVVHATPSAGPEPMCRRRWSSRPSRSRPSPCCNRPGRTACPCAG